MEPLSKLSIGEARMCDSFESNPACTEWEGWEGWERWYFGNDDAPGDTPGPQPEHAGGHHAETPPPARAEALH